MLSITTRWVRDVLVCWKIIAHVYIVPDLIKKFRSIPETAARSARIFHIKKKNRAKGNLWTKTHFIVKSISSNLWFLTLNEFTWQNWQKNSQCCCSLSPEKAFIPPKTRPRCCSCRALKSTGLWTLAGRAGGPGVIPAGFWQQADKEPLDVFPPQGKCSWYYLQHSHMSQQMPGTIRPRQQNSINRWGNSWH